MSEFRGPWAVWVPTEESLGPLHRDGVSIARALRDNRVVWRLGTVLAFETNREAVDHAQAAGWDYYQVLPVGRIPDNADAASRQAVRQQA